MSRQDPGAANGQIPTDLTRCTCGDLSSLHKPHDVTGVLGACSNSNCDCRRFTDQNGASQ